MARRRVREEPEPADASGSLTSSGDVESGTSESGFGGLDEITRVHAWKVQVKT